MTQRRRLNASLRFFSTTEGEWQQQPQRAKVSAVQWVAAIIQQPTTHAVSPYIHIQLV